MSEGGKNKVSPIGETIDTHGLLAKMCERLVEVKTKYKNDHVVAFRDAGTIRNRNPSRTLPRGNKSECRNNRVYVRFMRTG